MRSPSSARQTGIGSGGLPSNCGRLSLEKTGMSTQDEERGPGGMRSARDVHERAGNGSPPHKVKEEDPLDLNDVLLRG